MPASANDAFPSLVKVDRDVYLVCNPADGAAVYKNGTVVLPLGIRAESIGFKARSACMIATPIIFILASALSSDSLDRLSVFTGVLVPGLAGYAAGFVIGAFIEVAVSTAANIRMRRKRALEVVRVGRGEDAQAWELCRIAYNLSKVRSWQSGIVDPDRRVPPLLWEAVKRSIELKARISDATRALAHESLQALAQQTIKDAGRERAAVDQIGKNFMTILQTAVAIDERRNHHEEMLRLRDQQRREERELRQKLTGRTDPVSRALAGDHADESEGLAAQAASISELLAASDRLLRNDGYVGEQ